MAPRTGLVAALALILQGVSAPCGHAQRGEAEPTLGAGGEDEECAAALGTPETHPLAADAACVSGLGGEGGVRALGTVEGVQTPLELTTALGGVTIRSHGRRAAASLSIADCRLVAALLAWMPELTRIGVVGIEHMSIYRSGARVSGSGRPSGHARALAIDLSHLIFADGTVFEVEADWENPERGRDPCTEAAGESERMRGVRAAVCAASRSGLFQVVLTPNSDAAHSNHVHLEVRPDVSWAILR